MSSYTPSASVAGDCPTVGILTLGCKVNQYESQAIAEALVATGFVMRPPSEVCDVYIVNTCTVTGESDRKSRQGVRRLLKQNPNAFCVVTGCSVQNDPSSTAAIAGVDAIIGNRDKMTVVETVLSLLAHGGKNSAPSVNVPSLACAGFEPMTITRFDRTRAYVKIQDGCESRCTYCAIPAARGPVRSKPLPDIISEVTRLISGGCREVVLTGIETGCWGRDLGTGDLASLLAAVDAIPGDFRVRLGSLDPTVITSAFAETVPHLPSVAPHFHLSMQSGCAATLARMKRKYNPRQAEAAMARLRAAIPGVQFTTDMIVGFPGETEEEFSESLAFARRAAFLHIHVFPYSRRVGTPAAAMPHQVPEQIKHERVHRLTAVSNETTAAILDRVLKTYQKNQSPLPVLFETHNDGILTGHTPDFIEFCVRSDRDLRGHVVSVAPVRREDKTLIGQIMEFPPTRSSI